MIPFIYTGNHNSIFVIFCKKFITYFLLNQIVSIEEKKVWFSKKTIQSCQKNYCSIYKISKKSFYINNYLFFVLFVKFLSIKCIHFRKRISKIHSKCKICESFYVKFYLQFTLVYSVFSYMKKS